MKRVMLMIVVFLMMLLLTACPDKKEQGSQKEGEKSGQSASSENERVDKKQANVILENYMRFLMIGNQGGMKTFMAPELAAKVNTRASEQVQPTGYLIGEGETTKDSASFAVNIMNTNSKSGYFSNDAYRYVIKSVKGKLLIESVEKKGSTELYVNGDTLMHRKNGSLSGEKVMSLTDLPEFADAKESASPEQKHKTPAASFGPCAISPDGTVIVISTMDKDSFVGILSEDTSQAFAEGGAGGGKGGQGGAGGQGGQQGQQGSGQQGKTYKITMVDMYFGRQVTGISFSQDGKQFVVSHVPNSTVASGKSKKPIANKQAGKTAKTTTSNKSGKQNKAVAPTGRQMTEGSMIGVYNSENGERKTLKSSKQFRSAKFSFARPYYTAADELVFQLIPKKSASATERKFKGWWRLNLKTGKVIQF